MLFNNRELDRAFTFISESSFDIFCLQEVPEGFLKRLETLPYFIAFRTDVERLLKGGTSHNSVVILSKFPITAQGEIPFPDYTTILPLRTRIFIRLMQPFGFSKVRNRGGIFADIQAPGAPGGIRVFNLHLILAHPAWRLKEFEAAVAERDASRPTIICGDFNILEAPHITILNWLLGGLVRDAAFYKRERTHIEQRFIEQEMHNPLRGLITHPISLSQLDHILVSHSFSIKNVHVFPDRIGSDHHPVRVEVA